MIFTIIKTFLSGVSPKIWLIIFAVVIALGAFFWFRHSIYVSCETAQQAKDMAAKNEALKKSLLESQQYTAFLLNAQKKNDNFINKQKKDLFNAKENDGAVADNLRGTFKRMHDNRKNDQNR